MKTITTLIIAATTFSLSANANTFNQTSFLNETIDEEYQH